MSDTTHMPGCDLREVLVTDRLAGRSAHGPDFKAEADVLLRVSSSPTTGPASAIDELLRGAMSLCKGGSAGISLLDRGGQDTRFHWTNVVGAYRSYVGGTTPATFSPCAETLQRTAPQLFANPERYFSYLVGITPIPEEVLIVPFQVAGDYTCTMWVVSHDRQVGFDLEDVHTMERLATCAGSLIDNSRSKERERNQAPPEGTTSRMSRALVVAAERELVESAELRERLAAADALIARLTQDAVTSDTDARSAATAAHHAQGERDRAEEAQELAEALVRFSHSLAGHLDPARLAGLTAHYACTLSPGSVAAFVQVPAEGDGIQLAITAVSRRADGMVTDEECHIPLPGLPVTGAISVPLVDQRMGADDAVVARARALADGGTVQCVAIAPIHSPSGRLLGEIVLADGERGRLGERHLRIAQSLGAIAANAFDNAEFFRKERRLRGALQERERLALLYGAVGRALVEPADRDTTLRVCCEAITTGLEAAFTRIWAIGADPATLVLRASAGKYTHLDGAHARIPVGAYKIGRIARDRAPHISNDVPNDPEVSDQEWARTEGMVAFAGYPLIVDDAVVGVIGLFSTRALSTATLELLAVMSSGIANYIARLAKDEHLAAAAAALQQVNHDLDRFVGIASHDLIEPTRTASGFLELLDMRYSDRLDERGVGYLKRARDGLGRMGRLIRSLLEFSRLAQAPQALSAVALETAVSEAVANLGSSLADQGATVRWEPLPNALGDLALLVQLFQNLLANGIKFRRPAIPPVVVVSAEDDGDSWRIVVTDNGIGILPENQEKIFAIFQRLHSVAEYAGSGIGLATCRRIVQSCRGRIWVESQVGVGSRFMFTLAKA